MVLLMGLHLVEVVVDNGHLQRRRDVIAQHAQLSEGIVRLPVIDIADPNSKPLERMGHRSLVCLWK